LFILYSNIKTKNTLAMFLGVFSLNKGKRTELQNPKPWLVEDERSA